MIPENVLEMKNSVNATVQPAELLRANSLWTRPMVFRDVPGKGCNDSCGIRTENTLFLRGTPRQSGWRC